ncbi:hypothetical protein C4578_01615 [Candidatus Microgenomates bacterium]|jgi:hypothetical protein|nr:MAG: hypothetical protein C4578_01615 [Candidatus Microgenomates bacterium]
MVTEELMDYIKVQTTSGVGGGKIKEVLRANGWQEIDINEAFKKANEPQTPAVASSSSMLQGQSRPENNNPGTIPGPFSLLKETFLSIKDKLPTLLGILFVPLLLQALIFLLVTVFGAGVSAIFINRGAGFSSSNMIIVFVLVAVFIILSFYFSYLSIIAFVEALSGNEKRKIMDYLKAAGKKFFKVWWAGALMGLIIFGGFIFFIFPGIFIAFSLSFVIFVVITEDVYGLKALLKSRYYVNRARAKVIGRIIFAEAAIFLVSFIFSFLLGLIVKNNKNTFLSLLTNTGNIILSGFVLVYCYRLFEHVRRLKGDEDFVPSKKIEFFYIFLAILPFLIMISALIISIVTSYKTPVVPMVLPNST